MCEISELIKPIIKKINHITAVLANLKAEITKHFVDFKSGSDLDDAVVSDLLEIREDYENDLAELQSRKDTLDEEYFAAEGKVKDLVKEVYSLMRIGEQ